MTEIDQLAVYAAIGKQRTNWRTLAYGGTDFTYRANIEVMFE